MKIDRIDVAHDEIIENCEEYLIVSASTTDDDEYITRAFLSTNGYLLKEILIEEMNKNELVFTFLQDLIDDYKQQINQNNKNE
tara:strand:- start:3316 stop:3564 length:249 start_codon:yes stop_codon:yes gene_type:complete